MCAQMKHVILNGFIFCKATEYEILSLSLSGILFASNVKIPSRARVRVKRLKYIISVKLPPKAFKLRQQSAKEMCIAIKVLLFETNSEICHRLHRRDEDVLVLMCEFQSRKKTFEAPPHASRGVFFHQAAISVFFMRSRSPKNIGS